MAMTRIEVQGKADDRVAKAIRMLFDYVEILKGSLDELKGATQKEVPAARTGGLLEQGLNLGLSAPIKISSGNGTPEGSVLGSVGDLYVDQKGGAATVLYVKETGNSTRSGWGPK